MASPRAARRSVRWPRPPTLPCGGWAAMSRVTVSRSASPGRSPS